MDESKGEISVTPPERPPSPSCFPNALPPSCDFLMSASRILPSLHASPFPTPFQSHTSRKNMCSFPWVLPLVPSIACSVRTSSVLGVCQIQVMDAHFLGFFFSYPFPPRCYWFHFVFLPRFERCPPGSRSLLLPSLFSGPATQTVPLLPPRMVRSFSCSCPSFPLGPRPSLALRDVSFFEFTVRSFSFTKKMID